MQTFLPYPDFDKSARVLDYRRLGKQRLEAKQILNTLEGTSSGWANHPTVLMWKGYEDALRIYFNVMSEEWQRRGYKHNMGYFATGKADLPWWLGNEAFHLSHQSNLVRKDATFYGPLFPGVGPDLEYVWPCRSGQ